MNINKKETILITGGSGYIATKLTSFLFNQGFNIIQIIRGNNLNNNPNIKVLNFDLNDDRLYTELDKHQINFVIQTVSDSSSKILNYDIGKINDNNVTTNWRIANYFSTKNIKLYIYISTIHVYNSNSKNISNNTKCNPHSIYGLTHYLSENINNYYNSTSKTKYINIRLSNSYGFVNSKSWINPIINEFCFTAITENCIKLRSSKPIYRDFIHLNDLASSIYLLITKRDAINFNNINICTGYSYSLLTISQMIKNICKVKYNKDIEIFIKDKLISSEIKITYKKIFKTDFNKKIGFNPSISIFEGIENTIESINEFFN